MNKLFLVLVSVAVLTVGSSNAAIYKGQRVFVKECVQCHDGGQSFIAGKKIREWKRLMNKKGKGLAELHLENKKAKKSWRYFDSRQYTRKTKHLAQFLIEYAKDSGNVPACN